MQTHTTTAPVSRLQVPDKQDNGPVAMVSVITPAYNEEVIIEKNLERLYAYMTGLEPQYSWEIIVVNDGSSDKTGTLADAFAATHPKVRVVHHVVNRNLGGAMQTGFGKAKGDIVIVMDLDLSYHESHIETMLSEMDATGADIVVASPYMKGGRSTAVPFSRLMLSKVVNRLMRSNSETKIHTFTSMVRAYRKPFLDKLNLKSNTYSIMPEIIQKALILRGKVIEIPAHLDWSFQDHAIGRTSSIRIFKGILAGLMSSYIQRPFAFFMTIGALLMLMSLYMLGWILFHIVDIYPSLDIVNVFPDDRFSEAIRQVFSQRPHTFFVAGITLVISLQFISTGFLSIQNKRYFDELFHINSQQFSALRNNQE